MQNNRNIIIMVAPIIPFAAFLLNALGESMILFLVPLVVSLLFVTKLTKRLNTKDAVSYPFVQYPFLIILIYLFQTTNVGLGFILTLPLVFIINMSMGILYFRFSKKKKWFIKVIISIITLIIAVLFTPTDV